MNQPKLRHWLNPLTVLLATTATWTTPSLANETNFAANSDVFQGRDSIEIYVPLPETNNNGMCSAFLEPAISSIVGVNQSRWGILVESLKDGTPLYSLNSDKFFIPASNTKIFTTAAALQRLTPQTSIRSKSLKDWIDITNQRSDNNYADTLLSYIGGASAAKSALTQLGINPSGYRLADGSGLSRSNAATPRALVDTLRAMYFSPNKDVFYASLPVAGISGTLRNRMRSTAAQGTVYAKTGTLQGVRALSGYINHPTYGVLVFSILANNPNQSGDALVREIDNIVLQLSLVRPCEGL